MASVRALRGALASAVLLILNPVTLGPASADNWPSRPISTISAVSAGNAGDTIARIVLDQVSKQIGQSFVLENRPGGGGTIGTTAVAKAEPGRLHGAAADVVAELLCRAAQDAVLRSVPRFRAGGAVRRAAERAGGRAVERLEVRRRSGRGGQGEARRAELRVGRLGSASHWAAERLRLATGINVQHIPFRGPVEAFTEVMTGRVDFYYLPITPALPNIREGKIVALAVSTPQRAPALPDVQTVAEAGYPDAEYLFWGGLAFPAKTPRAHRRTAARRDQQGARGAGGAGAARRSLACCPGRWAWTSSPRSSTTRSRRP